MNSLYQFQMLRLEQQLEVPTIDGGKAKVKIPAGTQTWKTIQIKR